MKGIYCYVDKRDDSVVYVGKDSHIDKNKRHKDHHQPCNYDDQAINRILQKNPGRYEYRVLETGIEDEDEFNELEMFYIEKYYTYENGFNYTKGGENTPKYWLGKKGEEHCRYGEHHTEESKMKISESKKGQIPWMKGKKHRPESKKKISDAKKGNLKGKDNPSSKYSMWNNEKCHYDRNKLFRGKRDGSVPYRCFKLKYDGRDIPIGLNLDFLSCEIIHDLIKEEVNK